MDVSVIIAKSRIQTNTSAGQKSDALMLQDLNIVWKDIFSRLATKSKKYTWQTYKASTIANQTEYTIPKPTVSDTGIKRVLNVSVKYRSDGDYKVCRTYDGSMPLDSSYNDTEYPYCIERDGSIFVYPAPTESITDGLIVDGQYIPLDLELTTVSANIKLASEYHDTLLIGLNAWNFGDKQLFDKQGLMKQQFEEGMQRMLQEGAMDIDSAWYEEQPQNLDDYS